MRSLSRPFIAASLALFALPCFAITKAPPALKHVGGNVWEAVHDAGNTVSTTRTWAKGTEIGSAKATDVFTWVYRERSKIPITATTTIGASAVARVAAKTLPIIGTASLAHDIWTELGCQFVNGSVLCEELLEPESEILERWATNYPHFEAPTAWGLCTIYAANFGMLPKELLPGDYESQRVCRYGTQEQINQGSFYGGVLLTRLDGSATGQRCRDGERFIGDKCTGGQPKPCDEECLVDRWGKGGPSVPGFADKAPDVVREGVGAGVPAPSSPPQVSGPPSVSSPGPSTTTTTPSGTTTTSNTTNVVNLTYNGSQIIINETTTTSNSDGTVTETTDQPFPEWLCGVLGMPDCNVKVNETGTPEWEQPDNSRLDDIKAADAAKMDEVAQTIPQPDLGWFGAPPLAACRPYPLPNNMGEIDACAVVDSVRSVMAYLWALVAAWVAFGWIRQAVNGG